MNRSKLAVAAAFFGGLGLFDAVVGPLLARIELIAPMAAFYFWILGSLAGIIGLVIGLLALRPTGAGGKTGRGLALVGIVSGAVLLGVFLLNAGQGGDYPPINDITTDLADPPQFKSDPADRGRDMAYPADFVPTVKAAYGDLASIVSRKGPAKSGGGFSASPTSSSGFRLQRPSPLSRPAEGRAPSGRPEIAIVRFALSPPPASAARMSSGMAWSSVPLACAA